jgi:transcriptional regulator with XRE-family HTH domain
MTAGPRRAWKGAAEDPLADLGPAMVLLRVKRRLKQYEVASAAGFTRGQLSAYEGERTRPSLQSLGRFLDALGADLGDLYAALRLVRARRHQQQERTPGEAAMAAAPAQGLTDDEIVETTTHLLGLLRERLLLRGDDGRLVNPDEGARS